MPVFNPNPPISPGEGHINLFGQNYQTIGQGTWSLSTGSEALTFGNTIWRTTTHADGDNFTFKVFLAKGTYTLRALTNEGSNIGITDIDIDGVEVMSFDGYAGVNASNIIDTQTGIVISGNGLKTITVRTHGKNASSSDYYLYFGALCLWRTA